MAHRRSGKSLFSHYAAFNMHYWTIRKGQSVFHLQPTTHRINMPNGHIIKAIQAVCLRTALSFGKFGEKVLAFWSCHQ